MAKNQIINLFCFGEEIGRIGYDLDRNTSFFQYHPDFLKTGKFSKMFPYIFKRTDRIQVFSKYNTETFKGLPPMIADSLPDVFGNIIFKAWLEALDKDFEKITVLKQLAYVGSRGMGALEYKPNVKINKGATIDLDDIIKVLTKVLDQKQHISGDRLDTKALFNVFKIGSSAGGARPKILVAEHKETKKIIPGDMVYSEEYNHYLIKLNIPEEPYDYSREIVEYCYYLTATELGIEMMPSHLVDGKHFATLRFDRQYGEKQHILTASGMTGWDFQDPSESSYENLFKLTASLKIPQAEIDQLFKRMIFNLVFFNIDDHLKNHSFIYDPQKDSWNLSPAYDLTYSLNPLLKVTKVSRALSINNKRTNIELADVLSIAEKYSIKNPLKIITSTQEKIKYWKINAIKLQIHERIIEGIMKDFKVL
jgi:serine/threonine-protein kinase HipA